MTRRGESGRVLVPEIGSMTGELWSLILMKHLIVFATWTRCGMTSETAALFKRIRQACRRAVRRNGRGRT